MDFIPHTDQETAEMLAALGLESLDDLFKVIPAELQTKSWNLPHPLSESEVTTRLGEMSEENAHRLVVFLGAGYYDHFIPAAVDSILRRGEFYTAYTPYQPETSQGTLQIIYEYQTAICRLTGLDAGNASLYDGGTGLVEACMMAARKTRRGKVLVCTSVSPIYRTMLRSYLVNPKIEVVEDDFSDPAKLAAALDGDVAGVIMQNPDFFGRVRDLSEHFAKVKENKSIPILSFNPISLGVLKTPAEMGAFIAVGEGQPLGMPLSFGGPYLGIMAVDKSLVRGMPGRLVGATVDHDGRQGYCLTLQTREQHIRREKATSNICSNQALCALAAIAYLSLIGKEGLVELAKQNMALAAYARQRLTAIKGVELVDDGPWFNEFRVSLPIDAREAVGRLIPKGLAAGFPLGRYYPKQTNNLLVAVTEKRTKEEIGRLAEGLEAIL